MSNNKYGEFDSAEELNQAAAGQLEQGDHEALFEIAAENGIDKEDAQDYIDGNAPVLATPLMAAFGKLDVENKELKLTEIMDDWLNYIRIQCQENHAMCTAVRRKGKSLAGCIGTILKWSFTNKYSVQQSIVEAASGVPGNVQMGIPGMKQAKQLINDYYLR